MTEERPGLSRSERIRYGRHLLLPEVGVEGQERLKAASVLVVGAGGLGAPVLLYLAAAGVGRIGIMDDDVVSLSNLQRQVHFVEADVGLPKAMCAAERVRSLNSGMIIDAYPERLTAANAMERIADFDIVVDASDNLQTRYLLSDACVLARKPLVYGSVYRFDGQVSVFDARIGPCYRCLFPVPPPPELSPDCGESGVLGAVPGVVGSIQAAEVIKLITGIGEPLSGKLLLIDTLGSGFQTISVPRDSACPACGPGATMTELVDYDAFCGVIPVGNVPGISPEDLSQRLGSHSPPLLLDVRRPHERQLVHIGGTLVPEDELEQRLDEIDRLEPIVVYCRSGVRSARAVQLLRNRGFEQALNLEGGLVAWAEQVDPSLPLY